jgi:hypothetical protein
MNSFTQLMIIYSSILLITVTTLPIEDATTQKSGLSGNQLIHQVNKIIEKYVGAELTKVAENSNSTSDIIDKLNSNNDKDSKVTIHVQNFTSVLPVTELSFKPNPEVLDNKQIKTEYSNSTHNKIKVTENESKESSESEIVKRESSNENSAENSDEYIGESGEEAFGCDAAELDALVATYDPSKYEDDAETTTESISNEPSESSRTSNTDNSIVIPADPAKLIDQPTEAPSNAKTTKMEEIMKKIAEVSAVPVILTQGV